MEHMNWFSLIIATLTPMIMGFIFYHPKLFGTAWMNSLGLSEEDFKNQNKVIVFGFAIIMSFILAFFMVNFNNGPGQEGQFDTFLHGAFHGLILGIVVAMPVLVINGLFELRDLKNLAINTLYWIITLTLMGGIVDAMNHWPNDMTF
jgi:hypothetical protein